VSYLVLVSLASGLAGCATRFTGDPKFPGGARGCFDACKREGMVMSSYVFVGEYSTGCVCSLKPTPAPQPSPATSGGQSDATAASSAAAVGVVMQMRRAQEEQQRQQQMTY
jgi:hypothetical protein